VLNKLQGLGFANIPSDNGTRGEDEQVAAVGGLGFGLQVEQLRVEPGVARVERVALGGDQAGGGGHVVRLGGAVGRHRLGLGVGVDEAGAAARLDPGPGVLRLGGDAAQGGLLGSRGARAFAGVGLMVLAGGSGGGSGGGGSSGRGGGGGGGGGGVRFRFAAGSGGSSHGAHGSTAGGQAGPEQSSSKQPHACPAAWRQPWRA